MRETAWNPVDKTSPEARSELTITQNKTLILIPIDLIAVTDYTVKIRNFLHHFLKVDPWVRITDTTVHLFDLIINKLFERRRDLR